MNLHRITQQFVGRTAPLVSWRAFLAIVVAVGVVVAGNSTGAMAQGVDRAESDLEAASAEREASEARLLRLTAAHDDLVAQVEKRFAGAEQLAEEIESARNAMRRSAVDAFVNADAEDRMFGLLSGDDLVEASHRATYTAEVTVDWSEALANFELIKQDNDPELIALVERKEDAAARLADATDAVFQARATEADAERALAQSQAEAETQRAERAAEESTRPTVTTRTSAAGSSSPQPTAPAPKAPPTTRAPAAPVVPSLEFSAPIPDLPSFGPSEEQWAALRACESGGNYQIVSGSGRYRGAYQFSVATWESVGGSGDPAAAPPAEQDARAKLLYAERGVRSWPHCGRHLY